MDIKIVISEAIKEYKLVSESIYSREKSWNLCHESFIKLMNDCCYKAEEKNNLLAIELAAYLASYGMYRNSFLLSVNYKALVGITEILMQEKYEHLKNFESKEQIKDIFKLK